MIEVKISFSTPDELVAFFSKAQVQTIPAAQHELPLNLPQGAVLKDAATGVVEMPLPGKSFVQGAMEQVDAIVAAKGEQPLPEEPALKPKKAAKGKSVTARAETQAESGANNLGSASLESPTEPSPGEGAVEQAGAEAVDAASDAPAADVKYTIDDARAALTRLNDRDGIDAVRTLLAQMGASRISELPAAKYGELIATCPAA